MAKRLESLLKTYQKLAGLSDWSITVTLSDEAHPERVGDASILTDYEQAHITLYKPNIKGGETQKGVLAHEVGEVLAAVCCSHLSEKQYDSEPIMRVRDRVADAFRRIVERMEK